jgi:predicted PurR-regulated permease PerM
MTDERLTSALKVLMLVVLAFYVGSFLYGFFERIRTVVYIVVAAVFFAYLIYPAVLRLRKRIPLVLAILIVYAAILVALALAGRFIVPRIIREAGLLMQNYPAVAVRVHAFIYDPHDPLTSHLPDWLRRQLAQVPAEIETWIRLHGIQTVANTLSLLAGTFAAVAAFVIVPLITAYLLLDLENLLRAFSRLVPESRWRATLSLLHDVDAVIGGFVRGQLLVAISVGALITIALLILHVRYPFLFGLLAAIGDLIPYVGGILAFVPAFVSALATNGWPNAVLVGLSFGLIYEAEAHLLGPNIVSRTVRLSPLIVVLALLVGAELGGLAGMIVAVPLTGVLRVLILRVIPPPSAN